MYKEQKWHPVEENQQHISSFFLKINMFQEWMKKFVALLTKEKGLMTKNEWENDDSGFL